MDADRSSFFSSHSQSIFASASISRTPSAAVSLINYVPSAIGRGFQNTYEDSKIELSGSKSSLGTFNEDSHDNDERCQALWRSFRDEAGPWESHRFTLAEWDLPEQTTTRKNAAGTALVDDPEFDGSLTREIIATGLSNVDRCPVFYHYSYIKCVLSKKKLTDIQALGGYHYLQYVDVSGNRLTTLQPLGNLPFLKYLDASRNLLTSILDFKAPYFLTTVNLSRNRLKSMTDLSDFWSITDLNLSRNSIRNIDGLLGLRYLTTLNLSYNRIEAIENLMHLRIQFLYLQNNQIQAFDDDQKAMIDTLNNIRTINLSNNQISSLKIFEKVENLECLEICFNHVSQLLDIYYLRNLKYLNRLNLMGNTVTTLRRYVEVCITNITNLIYLDGEHINYEFWLQKLSNKPTDENQIASLKKFRLLMLEELNKPKMWEWLLPYDDPPIAIIVLVGLQDSGKAYIAREFCKENLSVVLGIPYTTRPKHPDEIEGDLFHYVDETKFRTMLKEGKFLTYQEHLGCYFGYAHSEFRKAQAGIMLFYTDLTMALSIKSRFVNTKLVLTLPSTSEALLNNLRKSYGIHLLDCSTMKVINSAAAAKYCEMEFRKTKKRLISEDVRMLVDYMVTQVSRQADLECKSDEQPDSAILKLWSESINYQPGRSEGRISRRITPYPYYVHEPGTFLRVPSSDDSDGFQKNEFPQSKCVSFTTNNISPGGSYRKLDNDSPQATSESTVDHIRWQEAGGPIVDDDGDPNEYYSYPEDEVLSQEYTAPGVDAEQVVEVEQAEPEPIVNDGIPKSDCDRVELNSEETKTQTEYGDFSFHQAEANAVDAADRMSWYEEDRDDEIDMSKVRPPKPSNFFDLHDSYQDVVSDNHKVRGVFMDELRQREQLLDLHWSTPGLFRELIFSDLEDEAIVKLTQLLRDVTKSHTMSSKPMFDFNNDGNVKTLIALKLKSCFRNIEKELSITEKQAAEYMVEKDSYDCGGTTCTNPACPPFK